MKFEPGMICFLIIDGELCKVRPLFNVSSQAPSWHAKIWDVKDNINSNSINSQAVTLSQVSSSFSMDGVLLWTPGPSWRKGNFYKQWTTRRSWNRRWSAEGSDCTSFILLLPFDLIGCHFCPWNLKRLRLIISCNSLSFFFWNFWGKKECCWKIKMADFISCQGRCPHQRCLFQEPSLWSLVSALWTKIWWSQMGHETKHCRWISPFNHWKWGESWWTFVLLCYTLIQEKIVQTVGFQTFEVQTQVQVPVAFLLPFEGFLFRITAQICMICSNVGSLHPKHVAPMKDIDRFSCRTLRWNIVTHVCVYNL